MGAQQIHDQYGKEVFRRAFDSRFNSAPASFSFGVGAGNARIDGVLDECIAVEIESRVSKQVRGALLDIAFHPLQLKLVALIRKYGNDYTEAQCRAILKRICPAGSRYEVVSLSGSGQVHDYDKDIETVKLAVQRLKQ